MTREELKEHCKKQVELCKMWAKAKGEEPHSIVYEEHKMILELLEQQPCEDCISRHAVDELSKELVHTTRDKADFICNFWEWLQKLPPVTPKEKTGHWFVDERPESDREVICSNCEQPVFKYHKLEFDYRPKFCPNCGARMVRE